MAFAWEEQQELRKQEEQHAWRGREQELMKEGTRSEKDEETLRGKEKHQMETWSRNDLEKRMKYQFEMNE